MNAEGLLVHYERIADAPEVVPRLRRFVLDLAVRGKLAPQDPDDEPASELLKRIAAEKARLVKVSGSKTPKGIPALEETPFRLPTGWCWSQMAEIGLLSPRNEAPDDRKVSFIPMPLIPADYGLAHEQEVRPWGEIKKGYTHFAERDVGLAKITPCFENGKSTVFRNLVSGIGAGTTELHIVRPVFIDPNYILVFLKSPHFIETGIPKMTGTAGQKRVPFEYFAYSPFPLPPLPEQRRIVAKIDELMALCDRLEAAHAKREATRDRLTAASLARLNTTNPEAFPDNARFALDALPALTARPNQIKQLHQTIINLAVRGKLVPQDPNDEPPKLSAEACDPRPNEIPDSWCHTRLDNLLSEDTRNGYSRRPDEAANGTPILRISAGTIRGDGIVAEEEHKLISGISSEDRVRYGLKAGDLLACRFNGNRAFVGRLTIFNDYLGMQPIYPDKLIRVRVAPELVLATYLRIAGDSDIVRSEVDAVCATTVGNWGISATNLKEIRFPIPPVAEQHRIVAKVDELIAICHKLEASVGTVDETRRCLLEALLVEALRLDDKCTMEAAE